MQLTAAGPRPIVKAEHILYVTFAEYATIEAAAKAAEKAQPFLVGKTIKKVIIVPKKMVNLIAG